MQKLALLSLLLILSFAPPRAVAQSESPQPAPEATPSPAAAANPTPAAISPTPAASPAPVTETLPRPAAPTAAKGYVPKYVEIGRSVRGRQIMAAIFPGGEKLVIIFAGIHGDEQATAILAKALTATLQRDPPENPPTIIIVPEVNPDGLMMQTRVNSAGVDINRNFPSNSWRADYTEQRRYPGKEPASEPETRAVIELLKRRTPDLIITLHAALGCMNWDGPGQEMASLMASANGYPLCPYLGYETPGSLGTYAGIDMKVPTVTIELRGAPAGEVVAENLPALRAALKQFSTPVEAAK